MRKRAKDAPITISCDVTCISPDPGETVVLTLKEAPPAVTYRSSEVMERIGDQLERAFPNNRVVVLTDQGMELAVRETAAAG